MKSNRLDTALTLVAVFGVALTALIEASHHYPVIMELCGGTSSGCSDVASTSFARIFGIPVSWLGMASYILFIALLRKAPHFILPLASFLMGAELYFLWVMSAILQTYCTFCLIQLGTVTLLFILTLFWASGRDDFVLPQKLWSAPAVVALAFALLAIPVKLEMKEATLHKEMSLSTWFGDRSAKVTVEIFSDYQCGHCKKLEPVVEEMMVKHPDILIIFRDFVIRSHKLSPVAVSYANAIAFTKGPEAFVKTRTELFDHQEELYPYLQKRLPLVDFTDEMKKRIDEKVKRDMKRAEALGVHSTPTLAIYHGEELVQIVRGAQPYSSFSRFLAP